MRAIKKTPILVGIEAIQGDLINLVNHEVPDLDIGSEDVGVTKYITRGRLRMWNFQVAASNGRDINPAVKAFPVQAYNLRIRTGKYPYINQLLNQFPRALGAHISCLLPDSSLLPHRDTPSESIYRFHLPILTNHKAVMIVDDIEYSMSSDGFLWAMDVSHIHWAKNEHKELPRYHLTWYMPRDGVFFEP